MTKTRITLLAVAGVIPVVLALWIAGFDVAYQLGHYVVSDNAVVTGDLIQASSPSAGQVTDLLVNVGEPVERGQALVSLAAGSAALGPASTSLRLATRVRAPSEGTVVFLPVERGQSVSAGQPVAVLADLQQLWVVANIDETSFKSVRPRQKAEIYLPALDRTFEGQVAEILPAAAGLSGGGTSAIRPPAAGTAKTVSQLPVRIELDYGDAPVLPGMTATVRIYIQG